MYFLLLCFPHPQKRNGPCPELRIHRIINVIHSENIFRKKGDDDDDDDYDEDDDDDGDDGDEEEEDDDDEDDE